MGSVKKWVSAGGLADPMGAAYRTAAGSRYNGPLSGDQSLTTKNAVDPGGIFHNQGANSPLGTPIPGPPDPNAPGSIFNMPGAHGPYINPLTNMRAGYMGTPTLAAPYGQPGAPPQGGMPAGTPTNGLSSQPDWASIIGRALRK